MATCYRCGRPIPSDQFKMRRRVKTGESVRRRYPNPNVSTLHVHYGIRVVCSACAWIIDREQAQRDFKQYLELALALLLLAATLAYSYLSSLS